MRLLKELFDRNRQWSASMREKDPDFFPRLSRLQAPDYLWIGCSDSRVPANQVIGLEPGEVFVHRNVANLVVHTDLNCLSVIQYAVEALEVKHIIVCGHYQCGGVQAALRGDELGLIENWLRHIQDVQQKHVDLLNSIEDFDGRVNRLCELNVVDQVVNVCRTTILRDAWKRGQDVAVHGWIYGLSDGILRDTGMCVSNLDEMEPVAENTVQQLCEGIA